MALLAFCKRFQCELLPFIVVNVCKLNDIWPSTSGLTTWHPHSVVKHFKWTLQIYGATMRARTRPTWWNIDIHDGPCWPVFFAHCKTCFMRVRARKMSKSNLAADYKYTAEHGCDCPYFSCLLKRSIVGSNTPENFWNTLTVTIVKHPKVAFENRYTNSVCNSNKTKQNKKKQINRFNKTKTIFEMRKTKQKKNNK